MSRITFERFSKEKIRYNILTPRLRENQENSTKIDYVFIRENFLFKEYVNNLKIN